MSEPALSLSGLNKRFGAVVAADNLELEVAAGEIHALIGPNGAGKTTLIAQISGELAPDSGRIRFLGRDITGLAVHERSRAGLGRTYQITSVFKDFNVLNNVILAVMARKGQGFGFVRPARSDPTLRDPAMEILRQMGLEARARDKAGALSHGEQRQLELALALALKPKLLMLDEPMAGMGPEDGQNMVEFLQGLKGDCAMLLVEHDMDAVFALADTISVLDYGRLIASGPPETIRTDEAVRRAYLGTD
ncbi:MAG: ABC transporter ATP-binding protein [Hyphomicrobiales bacterium]|nr:MAG: ABC transporter ATP-binding protein [Hyphomicrobiales bacterium]